jgi:hypothetical protein
LTADDPAAIGNLENLIEDNNGFLLFQAIEKAKIELSSYERSMIYFGERPVFFSDFNSALRIPQFFGRDRGGCRRLRGINISCEAKCGNLDS